jgi:NAD-dependent deacetylase
LIVPTTSSLSAAQTHALDALAGDIRARPPLVAFTGAGISTESGIPDYRGPEGLWTTGSQKPLTYDAFMSDPDTRRGWWRSLPERAAQLQSKQPNEGHRALVRLERADVLLATITQNIDNLHLWAGAAPERLIELHGNTRSIRCVNCGTVFPITDFVELAATHHEPLPCPVCGGVLKSATIAFGEQMPQRELRMALLVAQQAGVMLVVGSTLLVNPAARAPGIAKEAGAYLAILNRGATALDEVADLVLDVPAGPALTYLADAVLDAAQTAAPTTP